MSSKLSHVSIKHRVSYILNDSDERSTSRQDPMMIDAPPVRKRHGNGSAGGGSSNEALDDEKKHKCDLCSKRFKLCADLRKHKDNVHLGIKKFECHLCGHKFSERGNLNKHVKRIHEKSRTVTCPVEGCLSSFVLKEGLIRHMKVHEKAFRGDLGSAVRPRSGGSSTNRALAPRSSSQHNAMYRSRPW